MGDIELPESCSHEGLAGALNSAKAWEVKNEKIVFILPPRCFFEPAAMALLVTWGLAARKAGCSIVFIGDDDSRRYLSRMDIMKTLGTEFTETFRRHEELGRFLPVKLIDSKESIGAANTAICELVLRNFSNAKEFLPALEWSVYELLDNIRNHSQTPVPGAVCAQYFPRIHTIEIGIADYGIGIRRSLSEAEHLSSDAEAIKRAITRGITRNKDVGAGNGLAGTVEIAQANSGEFHLWSGEASFHMGKGFKPMHCTHGTGIKLALDAWRPVDLSKTFIGSTGWSYMDCITERAEAHGGFKIKEECAHVGGREPAQELRLKLLALLENSEDPLTLDFQGIEMTSSSFLDELLGKLAKQIGEKTLRDRVKLVNVNPTIQNMINQAVGERLKNG